MNAKGAIVGTMFVLAAGALPVQAHHSFAAEYDANKPVTITGTVTKLEWMNPHARFYVDVKEPDGKVTQWNFELGAHSRAVKQGWRGLAEAGDRSPSKARARKTAHHRQRAEREAGRRPARVRRIVGRRRRRRINDGDAGART